MITKSRIITIGVLFALKFLFGFWLFRTGKRYNVVILTIHKLVALGIIVVLILTVNGARDVELKTAHIIAIAITGVLFVLAIATGGLMSTDKTMPAIVTTVHQIAPFLSILSTIAMLYLLVRGL